MRESIDKITREPKQIHAPTACKQHVYLPKSNKQVVEKAKRERYKESEVRKS